MTTAQARWVAPPVGVVARAEGQRGCPERVHASQDYSQPDAHPAPASPVIDRKPLLEPLWGFSVSIPTPGFRRMHRRVRHQVLCPRASRARSPPARMPSECPFARFPGLKDPLGIIDTKPGRSPGLGPPRRCWTAIRDPRTASGALCICRGIVPTDYAGLALPFRLLSSLTISTRPRTERTSPSTKRTWPVIPVKERAKGRSILGRLYWL